MKLFLAPFLLPLYFSIFDCCQSDTYWIAKDARILVVLKITAKSV